jgi:hypothetical protein
MLNSTYNTLAFSVFYMCNAFKLYAKKSGDEMLQCCVFIPVGVRLLL